MKKSQASENWYKKCNGCWWRYKWNHKCDWLMWLLCQVAGLNKKELMFIDCTPEKKIIEENK